MQLKTWGLVIKEQTIGESDRLVTVLTRDEGVLRAFAKRAKNMKDSKSSATQLLCYSRFNIYKGRDKYIINDAFPIEVFFDLRKAITKLALAQYFCQLAAELAPEGVEASEFLRIVLNTLHFLCKDKRPELVLKSIFEMRILTCAGYMPNLIYCEDCGAYEAEKMHFTVGEGKIFCDDCFVKTEELSVTLGQAAMKAMRHIVYSDFEKLYSFSLSDTAAKELSVACETYMLNIIQKRLDTLEFYHSLY
jgi:DNA repair protein RecO